VLAQFSAAAGHLLLLLLHAALSAALLLRYRPAKAQYMSQSSCSTSTGKAEYAAYSNEIAAALLHLPGAALVIEQHFHALPAAASGWKVALCFAAFVTELISCFNPACRVTLSCLPT
jgi:hypothetical protein